MTGLKEKTYIGDSVYAEWDGDRLTLTTENGYPDDPRNRIILDPETLRTLAKWLDYIKAKAKGEPSC